MTRQAVNLVTAIVEAVDADLRDENELWRSIARKLKTEGDIELRYYGPGRPEKAGERFLDLDYSAVDLTAAEADLFDSVLTEEPT